MAGVFVCCADTLGSYQPFCFRRLTRNKSILSRPRILGETAAGPEAERGILNNTTHAHLSCSMYFLKWR